MAAKTWMDLPIGTVVKVFEDPHTCDRFEGKARVVAKLAQSGHFQVEFLNEPGKRYPRWVLIPA